MKRTSIFPVTLTLCIISILPREALSQTYSFGFQQLKPQDYLYAPTPYSNRDRDLFDNMRPVEGRVDLGIGSDCGRISIDGTLRSTFNNVLKGSYFSGLISDVLGGVPMLTACYMSPTWCAVLKHTQLSANFLTQTRLNQCQIIDKYVDSRTEDYYRERQTCTQRAIQQNGGDMEQAMASCQNNIYEAKVGKWAGSTRDNPNQPNELIGDSTRWAGFEGPNAKRITNLLTSMVGDTVISQGNIRVEYGPKAHAYSPRSHLLSLEKVVADEFCGKLIPPLANSAESGRYLSNAEIESKVKDFWKRTDDSSTAESDQLQLITPDLLRNLSYLSVERRNRICLKLSQTIAMSSFTRDMSQSLDVLTVASQNPNLPPNRRQEIENKRSALKEQVEVTLKLKQEQTKPVGEVMQYIAQEGLSAQDQATHETLSLESTERSKDSHFKRMNDCSDGIFCDASSPRRN